MMPKNLAAPLTGDDLKGKNKLKRLARIYTDGSMNVSGPEETYEEALRGISGSNDDADTRLVEVEIMVLRDYGAPKLQVTKEDMVRYPCCHELFPSDAGGEV